MSTTKSLSCPTVLIIAVLGHLIVHSGNIHRLHASEHPVPESSLWLTYSGEQGPGKGKHIILIAADQEYRSEYSMPMMAKLLAKHHGFHCTVLFSLNQDNEVDPTQKIRWEDKSVMHNIPGLEYLEKCDLMILFSRLITLPPEQLQHIYRYLDSGKPIIGIRTANHGFIGFDYRQDGKKKRFRRKRAGWFIPEPSRTLAAGFHSWNHRRKEQKSSGSFGSWRHLGEVGCLSHVQRRRLSSRRLHTVSRRTTFDGTQS